YGTAGTRAQALDDFSGRSLYVLGRESVESMSTMERGILSHAQAVRLGGTDGSRAVGKFGVFASAGDDIVMRKASADEVGAHVSRPYIVTGVGRTARGRTSATTWGAAVKVSMNLSMEGSARVAPYAMVDYRSADIKGFSEAGAGGVGLVVPGHTVKNSLGELGAVVAMPSA